MYVYIPCHLFGHEVIEFFLIINTKNTRLTKIWPNIQNIEIHITFQCVSIKNHT